MFSDYTVPPSMKTSVEKIQLHF